MLNNYAWLALVFSVVTLGHTAKIFLDGIDGQELYDTHTNDSAVLNILPHFNGRAAVVFATTDVFGYKANLYVTGGINRYAGFDPTSSVQVIKTRGEIRNRPSLQMARAGHGITATSKEIFVCGGMYQNYAATNTCEKYDGKNNGGQWTFAGNLSQNLTGLKMATLNDIPYSFGGALYNTSTEGSRTAQSAVYAYDSANNTWTHVAKMPVAIYDHGVVELDASRALICGGQSDWLYQSFKKQCYIFDAVTNTFNETAPLELPLSGFGIVKVNDTIYVLGGRMYFNGGGYVSTHVFVSRSTELAWEHLPSLLKLQQERLSAVVVKRKDF